MVSTPNDTDTAAAPIRVLVADDEPSIRQLLAATLAPQGYEATAARDGDEAKRLLEREPFEVVITDHQMPGLNGIDVLRFANYVSMPEAAFCYTADRDGTVRQYSEDGTEQTS